MLTKGIATGLLLLSRWRPIVKDLAGFAIANLLESPGVVMPGAKEIVGNGNKGVGSRGARAGLVLGAL